ncbi:DedA family protein [Corynebacterium breve]|uniref:DedA family protein n=1 Tax=Corynebacterium breve TaxID=3049799 RepID=A0ABY8VEE4_9CORY|nr:DedA family protein [Corynebacterium breve]WIM68026.1 DedA family protein [Corynebacterium breve]
MTDDARENARDEAEQELDVAPADPTSEEETEWWEEPGMPWNQKPGKADFWCLGWIGFVGVFGMAMIPLRAWLLGLDPPIMLALTGSRLGAASTGALAAVGDAPGWIWYLLIGSVVAIKFDWVYWWAGKLWGRGMLDVYAEQSQRTARNIERVEKATQKLGWLGIFLAYVPIPLPIALVVFIMSGATGMKLSKFMVLNFISKTIWSLGYFALGYAIGEPVVFVLEQYQKVANWFAIGLLVVVFASVFFKQNKEAKKAQQ